MQQQTFKLLRRCLPLVLLFAAIANGVIAWHAWRMPGVDQILIVAPGQHFVSLTWTGETLWFEVTSIKGDLHDISEARVFPDKPDRDERSLIEISSYWWLCERVCGRGLHFRLNLEQSNRTPSFVDWAFSEKRYGFGFQYTSGLGNLGTLSLVVRSTQVIIPFWFGSLLLLAYPVKRSAVFLRSRGRAKAGLCPSCRYDLRAHKSGDKCPECGTVVSPN